jgi:3-deoxy-D-manno-octulosonic acid kinase
MVGIDTSENLVPFRDASGTGAILFDAKRLRQAGELAARPAWFDPGWWGARAQPVGSGGRGGAWFVDGVPGAFGAAVLRHYLRGGMMARLSRDLHLWRGASKVRSFEEFRLLRALLEKGLPVPRPIAALYRRHGGSYRAAILLDRLEGVRSLADRAADVDAPWEAAGALIARLHRAGLDHADLNAHNLLFGDGGEGWAIDLDRSIVRIPATAWRERNLARLQRSLLKLRGARGEQAVLADMARLRGAYDAAWERGY